MKQFSAGTILDACFMSKIGIRKTSIVVSEGFL